MIIYLIVNSLVIFFFAYILKGVKVKSFFTAVGISIILAIINTFIKPLIVLLTIPLTVLTLGLFIFVINAWIFMIIDSMLDGFEIKNFWWALLYSIFISAANALLF